MDHLVTYTQITAHNCCSSINQKFSIRISSQWINHIIWTNLSDFWTSCIATQYATFSKTNVNRKMISNVLYTKAGYWFQTLTSENTLTSLDFHDAQPLRLLAPKQRVWEYQIVLVIHRCTQIHLDQAPTVSILNFF